MEHPQQMPPVHVIVSAGRSGSTLISDILDEHPDVVSVSEFFLGLWTCGIHHRDQPIDAPDFCHILRSGLPTQNLLAHLGISIGENRYPFTRNGMRYAATDALPYPLLSALPRLSDDPDALFDTIIAAVLKRDGEKAGQHIEVALKVMASAGSGKIIVERSGGSLANVDHVFNLMPDLKPVVLLRDGLATALSMSKHPAFRHHIIRIFLANKLGHDPYLSGHLDGADTLPPALRCMMPDMITRARFEGIKIPVRAFGLSWSSAIRTGQKLLQDPVPSIAYEDLCEDPERVLRALTRILGVDAPTDWLARATAMVRPQSSAIEGLPADELAELTAACRSGNEILRQTRHI
jgi:putative sulfotransferase